MSIQFDGNNQLIIIGSGIYEIDAQEELYSAWKEWMQSGDNMKYHPAFDTPDGGRDLSPTLRNGDYYFLMNQDVPQVSGMSGYRDGWRLRPAEEDHELTINGNLYVADIGKPWVVPTIGPYTVLVRLETSSLTQTVVSGSGVTQQDKEDIAELTWQEATRGLTEEVDIGAVKGVPVTGVDDFKASVDETSLVNKIWDEPLTAINHNVQYSAGRRLRALGEVQVGQINDPSPTTTDFITDLTQTIDGFYDDQYIYFTSGALEGIVRIIADYNGTTKNIHLVKALPQAPANGDDFEVRAEHIHSLDDIVNAVWNELTSLHTTVGTFGYEILAKILQNREKNISYTFVKASSPNLTRNVGIGCLDYMEIKIKKDEDANWDSPESTGKLYLWYENVGDTNPIYVGEET
jgi:hypothetical protein